MNSENTADKAVDSDTSQTPDQFAYLYRVIGNTLQIAIVLNDRSMFADEIELFFTHCAELVFLDRG
ncbi:Uncharacterised protein [Klebsiella michiganensis]|uniref:Uncharacterized protein n=1 Tax=Klebsiella michiganensis TaxID=1134687 RepID=A0A7H4PN35_9ENTR|nr:Uncharacterised protein [Klebsiella michiganensis]